MTIEKQLTSLDLSKKLDELGVKAESEFSWVPPHKSEPAPGLVMRTEWEVIHHATFHVMIPAYSVAELIELLGESFGYLQYKRGMFVANSDGTHSDIEGETPADTLAKLLIYLIENSLIEAPK